MTKTGESFQASLEKSVFETKKIRFGVLLGVCEAIRFPTFLITVAVHYFVGCSHTEIEDTLEEDT